MTSTTRKRAFTRQQLELFDPTGFAEVSFIQEGKPAQTFLLHVLKLVWRPTRSGDFFNAFDGEIAVGVGHVVPDARAIEQSR